MTNQTCLALLLILPLGIGAQVGGAAEPVTVPLERETLVIPSGLEDWTLAWHASLVSLHNIEWVTGGESVENWTQLFTVSRVLVDPAMQADKFASLSLEGLRHRCPALRSAVYGESASDATYEWIVAGCPSAEDQDELVRIIRSGDYLFRIAYTRKGPDMDPRLRGHWLAVIRAIEPVHCCDADDKGLSAIPLLRLYASFDFNRTPGMQLWFEEERDEDAGGTLAVLKSAGFPREHRYDVFVISLSPTHDWRAMPFAQGLVADDSGALRCPKAGEELAPPADAVQGEDAAAAGGWNACEKMPAPGVPLSSLMRWKGLGFQPGLPMAAAVRAQDGSHAAYARVFGNPIEGSDGRCTVTLELVSNDARTYVAYGSGFPADETVSLAWKYGSNGGAHSVRTDSTGSFVAAVNHPGEAKGRGKWSAMLDADSSRCHVSVPYKWGEGGMKP